MEIKTAALTNTINEIGYKAFNNSSQITREQILSSFSQEALELIWSLFAKFVKQNYEAGKGTLIRGFGTFTFSNSEYNLEGTTNQYKRDIKIRRPVFVVSSEFVENLRPGQYTKSGGLIYYTQKVNNNIGIIKLNYAELAIASGIPKEELVTAFTNLIKDMGDSIKNNTFKSRDLPEIGVFVVRNNVFGIKFFDDFSSAIKLIPQKLIHIKKNIDLFMDVSQSNGARINNLENAEKAIKEIRPQTSVLTYLTRSGEKWLKDNMDIDVTQIHEDNKILENVNPKKRFCNQTFFNKNVQNIARIKNLKLIPLSKEILLSIVNSKTQLIKEMKNYDRRNNGIISKFELIRAFYKANTHYSLSIEKITDIIDAYAKEVDSVEYVKLIKCLIKDIKFLNYQEEINGEEYLFSSKLNKNASNNKWKCNNKASLFKPLSNSMSHPTFNALAPIDNYDNIPVNIHEVQNEIIAIKVILPTIISNNKDTLASPMSFINLINILREFSIIYPTDKILKILRFIQITNPNTFTLASFNEKIFQCKLTSYEMTNDEIMRIYDKLKAIIQYKGGKEMLFQDKNKINVNDFISNLHSKTNYTDNILTVLFDILSNKTGIFTLNDYQSLCDKSTNSNNLNAEFVSKTYKTINDHIAKKEMTINEYFNYLISLNICRNDNTLSKECFVNGLKLEHFDYSNDELEYIFKAIDRNNDGTINRVAFNKAINQDYHSLAKMQDSIKKSQLTIEDIAYQFDININEPPQKWTFYQFKEKMRIYDSSFSNQMIEGVFNELTKGEEVLYTNVLIDNFNVYKKEIFRNVNNETFKQNFIENIRNQVNYNTLKETFEAIDIKQSGQVTKSTFCSLVNRLTKEFKDEDILKFARVANLIDNSNSVYINYNNFINLVFDDAKTKEDAFVLCVREIERILRNDCNSSIDELIDKIISKTNSNYNKSVSLEMLFNYLKDKVQHLNMKAIEQFDIDLDGIISHKDIKGTLKANTSTVLCNNHNHLDNNSSIDDLTEANFKEIVKEIKNYIRKKNITEIGLFKMIDENNDGYISKRELNKKLDEIVPVLPNIKDKLFNYFDYFQNGDVDLQTFLLRLKEFKANEKLIKSNDTIEKQLFTSFSAWINKNSVLSDTELFSILDNDNDGIISLSDFKMFLIEILRMTKAEFNDLQLEKIIQAISLTKNKHFGFADLKEFISRTNANNLHLYYLDLAHVNISKESNLSSFQKKEKEEWLSQVINRFGMFVSENFENIEDFFNYYCDQDSKTFKIESIIDFHNKNSECFYGLNVSKNELSTLFNYLDTDNKNYLSLEDIRIKLKPYDFFLKMHNDFKQFLKANFLTHTSAFKFFVPSDENISKQDEDVIQPNKEGEIKTKDFFNGINYLFPKQYSTETILKYIKRYFNDNSSISYSKFSFLYYDKLIFNERFSEKKNTISKLAPLRGKQYLSARSSSSSLHQRSFKAVSHPQLKTPFDLDPIEKLKRLISSSKVDYSSYIKMSISLIPNGIVNQFEFKNIIKHLNLGLTTLEIDEIADKWSRGRDNSVNLKEFLQFINNQDKYITKAKNNIKFILGEIKQLLYKYYSNPKLGFEFNDPEIRRQMDFDKFKKIVYDMYRREDREMPNFALLKSVYDYIDLRKDGIVDLKEWTKVFGQIEGKYDVQLQNKQIKALREWELSNNVITIYKAIAHNKKIIRDMIKNVSFYQGQSSIIHEDNLIRILKEVFPKTNLTNTQWKMIVEIADQSHSKLIDVDLFIQLVEHSAQMEMSHPRFK